MASSICQCGNPSTQCICYMPLSAGAGIAVVNPANPNVIASAPVQQPFPSSVRRLNIFLCGYLINCVWSPFRNIQSMVVNLLLRLLQPHAPISCPISHSRSLNKHIRLYHTRSLLPSRKHPSLQTFTRLPKQPGKGRLQTRPLPQMLNDNSPALRHQRQMPLSRHQSPQHRPLLPLPLPPSRPAHHSPMPTSKSVLKCPLKGLGIQLAVNLLG